MSKFKTVFDQIIPHIQPKDFVIPNSRPHNSYFPDYMKNALSDFSTFYSSNLISKVDDLVPFDGGGKNVVYNKILELNSSINRTIELYYEGKVSEASNHFFNSLDKLLFDDIQSTVKIPENTSFYRARSDNGSHFKREDLFHIKFELRHIVSTNRYSIPGFPAIYLGDTTYVCWEEFNRCKLRDLWFVKIENQKELNILQIQRIEDLLDELRNINKDWQLTYLLRYLLTFPLALACTVKVLNPNGSFKPEYIIPQLLSEYISTKDEIDGIKFPSTKVEYSSLTNVKAYNYVFPVKKIAKSEFCSVLKDNFHLTEPTSLNLEEIIYNPTSPPIAVSGGNSEDIKQIELVKGQKSNYSNTSFGKLEKSLQGRELKKI